MRWPALFVSLLLIACGGGPSGGRAPARAVTPLDHATTGTISGTVDLSGAPPAMTVVPLRGDPVCAALHPEPVLSEDALVHDGHVENAFVYVKDGLGERVFAVPSTPVVIDQRGCLFQPHVAGAQVGQPIKFVNGDTVLHNVHGAPSRSGAWNFAMNTRGAERTVTMDAAEVAVPIRCDLHPWMRAYLGVLDHPYFAVTGANGRFTLTDVPPGDYTVAVWHERFGTREAPISLGTKDTKELSFTFTAARQ
jgi:plastocyanin